MPFEVSRQQRVLTLTLDTPGAAVNIFNRATADQLIHILTDLRSDDTDAVVFRSAKPNSFINGVGLLLAHSSRTYDDVVRASTPAWTAYRMVREAPVPTIAVVQGNCFGCGVEFALNCDFRIAVDTADTQFYMTELNDYLFIPLFGSTWNLPEAVGLEDSIDLLLWGERWGVRRAYERGLVDAVISPDAVEERLASISAAELTSRKQGRVAWAQREDLVMSSARQRIAALPPPYHAVYTDALELLAGGARQNGTYVEQQQRELERSAVSALSDSGKAAYSFFYLRQIASERVAGRQRDQSVGAMKIGIEPGDDSAVRAFAARAGSSRLAGVTWSPRDEADACIVAASLVAEDDDAMVGLQANFASAPQSRRELYAPLFAKGVRLVELTTAAGSDQPWRNEATRSIVRVLQRLGFELAWTTPASGFVTNRLLVAFLAPMLRLVEKGDAAGAIAAALRELGFVRHPRALLVGLDSKPLVAQLALALGRNVSEVEPLLAHLLAEPQSPLASGSELLADSLCLSLLEEARGLRDGGEVRDPAIIDLIAREVLDFPRHLCSLCTWLTKDRVTLALGNRAIESVASPSVLEASRKFVAEGREFYR